MIATVDRICEQCGKLFSTPAWRIKQGKRKFCSKGCFNKFQRGKPLPVSSQKLSLAQKDSYQRNPNRAINNSRVMKQLWQDPAFREKILTARDRPGAKRKHFEGNSRSAKRMWQNPEKKKQIIQARKERCQNPDYKLKMSQHFKRLWQDLQFRVKMSKRRHCGPKPEVASKRAKERWQSPEYRQHQIEAQLQSWQNPGIIARRLQAANKRPNKLEQQLMDILKIFPNFKYNGDFSQGVVLGGLIPDFVNVNGKKQVIELFGDYYHRPEISNKDWRRSELGKVMIYNSLGWKCLVIWEHDLKTKCEGEIIDMVRNFTNRR